MAYDTQNTRESIQTAESKRSLFVLLFITWAVEGRIEDKPQSTQVIRGVGGHQKSGK